MFCTTRLSFLFSFLNVHATITYRQKCKKQNQINHIAVSNEVTYACTSEQCVSLITVSEI